MESPIDKKETTEIYVKIFCSIGILAGTMVCLWIGYKMYQERKKTFYQSYDNGPVSERSFKNEMSQTSNDDFDQKKVVYRNHRKDRSFLRCPESGLLLNHELNLTSKSRLFSKSRFRLSRFWCINGG